MKPWSVDEPMWNWCLYWQWVSTLESLSLLLFVPLMLFYLPSFGAICDGLDLCTSRRILMPFPEAEGCFRGFSGPAILTQPGPPALGVHPELWERHCGGAPSLPPHTPLAGQYGPAREGRSQISLLRHRMRSVKPQSSVNASFFAHFRCG